MGILAIINDEKKFTFPENKIILINGKSIDCYPVTEEEKVEAIDDCLKLDTTGKYLAIGRKRFKPIPPTPKEVEEQRNLFINNAFYLLAHKEQIMNDSRMFLCPVAIQSGLAYTGTSGFTNPTLGIYIEWWLNCPGAMQTDKEGNRLLVYHLAGSPLSGVNHCMAVCENGKRQDVTLLPFNKHWKPFVEINWRYTEAKYKYQSYSFQQVLDILEKEDKGNIDYTHAIETDFLKHKILALTEEVDQLKAERDKWYKKYEELLIKNNKVKMQALYTEYQDLEYKTNNEIVQLRGQKKELKAALKSGQLDNKSYQQSLMPINRRIKDLECRLSLFKYDRVREVFPEGDVSFNMIEKYMKAEKRQI